MKKFKPNTELPAGGRLIKPVRKKIGPYVEQIYDAYVVVFGLGVYRVQGGLQGRNDREDWVVDLPGVGAAVSDYNWRNVGFGIFHGTFEQAVLQETISAFHYAVQKRDEKALTLARLRAGIRVSKFAVANAVRLSRGESRKKRKLLK